MRNKKIIILFLLALLVTIGPALGRFVYDEAKKMYLQTKNFYFESDKLREKIARYEIDNWNGVDTYSININLSSEKNNKVKSESDIAYEVQYKCSDNINCSSSKTTGVIYSSTNKDALMITLSPNVMLNEGDSVWVEVEATSTSPYSKTISGRFVLKVGRYGLSYKISDKQNSVHMEVEVTNTLDYYTVSEAFADYDVDDQIDINTYLGLNDIDKSKCYSAIVTIDFDPRTVVLDTASNVYSDAIETNYETLDGYRYINHIAFKIEAISSKNIRFYKRDVKNDYTNSNVVSVEFD